MCPAVARLPDKGDRLAGAGGDDGAHGLTESRDLAYNDLANAITETVPIYETYEERIKELRDWARTRARPATLDAKAADLFKGR